MLQEIEWATSSPFDNIIKFEILTPIGTFIYDNAGFFTKDNPISLFEKIGLKREDLMSIKSNDVRSIMFDIDISARIRKEE